MERTEIAERVANVICEVLDIDREMITPEAHLVFDLGAESTQSVQLVAAFEEEFGIDMDAEAALAVETVGGAVDFIAKCIG